MTIQLSQRTSTSDNGLKSGIGSLSAYRVRLTLLHISPEISLTQVYLFKGSCPGTCYSQGQSFRTSQGSSSTYMCPSCPCNLSRIDRVSRSVSRIASARSFLVSSRLRVRPSQVAILWPDPRVCFLIFSIASTTSSC